MNHRPVAIALTLCEQVVVDDRSRNLTMVNAFNARKASRFPERITFFVVAYLTDGLGTIPLEVVVERLDSLEEVFRLERTVQFTNPLLEARCIFRVRDCPLPVAGSYQISLLADRELVAHRRMLLT